MVIQVLNSKLGITLHLVVRIVEYQSFTFYVESSHLMVQKKTTT